MYQVTINCYDPALQINIEILRTGMVLLWPPENCVKNRNRNDCFTCKPIKIVVRYRI